MDFGGCPPKLGFRLFIEVETMLPGVPMDDPLIQGLLGTSRSFLGPLSALMRLQSRGLTESSKFGKSLSQSRHKLSDSRNQIWASSKTGVLAKSGLCFGRSTCP